MNTSDVKRVLEGALLCAAKPLTVSELRQVFTDEVFLDTMSKGILWATDKLDENGKPKAGYGPKAN